MVRGEAHSFIALEQAKEIPSVSAKLIQKPEGKNTSKALTFAAFQALKNGADPGLVVTPADQTVQNTQV